MLDIIVDCDSNIILALYVTILEIFRVQMPVTLTFTAVEWVKVKCKSANRKATCDSLFGNSNVSHICHNLRDINS